MERRLATILVGDFVGSTSRMEADEECAVRLITSAMELVTGCVTRNSGRVFNMAGDAMLAEFSSPVNALHAAIESRASLGSAPGLTPADMRFGLHVADVMTVGDDLRGDGVNIAARLQSTTDPGEIDVSGVLYDHVRRAAPCGFDMLGDRTLKGLAEPVQVMRVRATADRHVFQTATTVARPKPAQISSSVAVLPFRTASSAEEDQTYLAEGLTVDMIYELSRFKSLFVSSRTASQALDLLDRAATLDPFLPVWIVEERIAALYAIGRFADMSREAPNLAFQTRRTRIYRAAARVGLGDVPRAQDLIAEALADDATLSTDYVVSQELFQDSTVMQTLLDRVRSAGLPDGDPAELLVMAPVS